MLDLFETLDIHANVLVGGFSPSFASNKVQEIVSVAANNCKGINCTSNAKDNTHCNSVSSCGFQ
jgi:hypothetical protein